MGETALIEFNSQALFLSSFSNAIIGTGGGWKYQSSASSPTSFTGPGTNSRIAFIHTETSSGANASALVRKGRCNFDVVPTQVSRTLHLRMCIQGLFGDTSDAEGMRIQHRASSSASWSEAGFIPGWAYSDSYEPGDSITDYDRNVLTCVAPGGWVDFEIDIPDTATEVRFVPRLSGGTIYTHDIALRSIQWKWPTPPSLGSIGINMNTSVLSINEDFLTLGISKRTTGVTSGVSQRVFANAQQRSIVGYGSEKPYGLICEEITDKDWDWLKDNVGKRVLFRDPTGLMFYAIIGDMERLNDAAQSETEAYGVSIMLFIQETI